jgi:uncharacterized protein (DUF433 family)
MATAVSDPHILKPAGEPARLKNHPRLRVAQIVAAYLAYGWSPDEICRQFPGVQPVEAHAAMAYYYDHRDEIEAELRAELDQLDDQQRRPLAALAARLRQMKHAG